MQTDSLEYLENLDDPRTQRWLAGQAESTADYFRSIDGRDVLLARLKVLMNFPKIGVPWMRGDHVYYFGNRGLQNHSVVMRRPIGGSDEHVILDPNDFSNEGRVAIAGLRLSEDCHYLAFGLSKSGSDWQEWRVRDLETGKDLPERLSQIRGGVISWKADGTGFFYTKTLDERGAQSPTEPSQTVMFHRIYTAQSDDTPVFSSPIGQSWTLISKVSDDGLHLLIFAYESANDQNRIWVKEMQNLQAEAIPLVTDFSSYYVLFSSRDGKFWFRTNFAASNGQILELSINPLGQIKRRTIVAEQSGIIERASIVDETLIVTYLEHACSNIMLYHLDGSVRGPANVPKYGSLGGFEGLRHQKVCYFGFSSFNTPQTIYEFDVANNTSRLFWQHELPFDPDQFVTRQVFVDTAPGVHVSLFISHLRDLDLDSPKPCYLYSYGGFGFCHKPFFSTAHLQWMEAGGLFCLANVRGGGEYGQSWHDAGRLKNKQNTFVDFNGCAEWLIRQKLTRPELMAAGGRSNGGLTVAASVLRRPDLFRAAIVAVGVLDLLRFDQLTVGWTWKAEYGDPANPDDRQLLLQYSPMHNIKPHPDYPAFLVSTADHDDRVHPSHSFKFIQNLQSLNPRPTTKLLRVERQVGHGAGKPLNGYLEEITDFLAFLYRELAIVDRLTDQWKIN